MAKIPTDKTVRCFQILKYFFVETNSVEQFSSRIFTTDILSLFARTLSVKAPISSSERAADSFFRAAEPLFRAAEPFFRGFSHSEQGFSHSEQGFPPFGASKSEFGNTKYSMTMSLSKCLLI
jgi:hypothetical protein